MAVDKIGLTPGAGAYTATHKINEGGVDVHLQRTVPSTAEGDDVSVGSSITIDATLTRPANTTAYSIDDTWNPSTPETGGITFANASRGSGKSGLITDLDVFCSEAPATLLEGELWLFDSAITAVSDNVAFAPSIVDLRKRVARIPFVLLKTGTVSHAQVSAVNKSFTTVGSANLRGQVLVKNAYTPGSAAALTLRLNCMRTN